jgi:hypothetical protein
LVGVLVLLILGVVDKQVTSLRKFDQLPVSAGIALRVCSNDDAATLERNAEDEYLRHTSKQVVFPPYLVVVGPGIG